MNEGFDPDVVSEYERDTWSRCADDYVDTFAVWGPPEEQSSIGAFFVNSLENRFSGPGAARVLGLGQHGITTVGDTSQDCGNHTRERPTF